MTITRAKVDKKVLDYAGKHRWRPQPGPQRDCWKSKADIIFYGGAAGGGKTAIACGLALMRHQRTLFIRRESTQLKSVIDEMAVIMGSRDGYNSQEKVWRLGKINGKERVIYFGSCPHLGDEQRHQGNSRDLLVIDECCALLEIQARFLMGWVRTTDEKQPCRILLCSNPPTSSDGQWLTEMFAAWLDPQYRGVKALPGELRWYSNLNGKEVETGSEPFEYNGETIQPKSRTFIPAKIQDNKYLMKTGYMAQLQAMPEPLRSAMLFGDFTANSEDSEWAIIPSEWVRLAQKRWKNQEQDLDQGKLSSLGVDPSRGGRDQTVVARRYGWYYPELTRFEGKDMDKGGKVAAKVVEICGTSNCPVHIDVIGIGSSVIDHLEALIGDRAVAVISSAGSDETDFTGNLKFANYRAYLWWRFRDILNPDNGHNVCLPPDSQLYADLTAPTYSMSARGILVESKQDIKKRLGRSTDSADAVIYAAERTPILMRHGQGTPGGVQVHGSLRR